MRFHTFKKFMATGRKRLAPAEEWKKDFRSVLLAEIRKSEAWQNAPAFVHSQASLVRVFHMLFAKAIIKPAIAVLLVFSVVSYSSVATVSAARASLPGDLLYSVKLGMESAQTAVAFSESKKAQLEISFATTRLEEVSEILKQEDSPQSAPHITKAISRFNNDLNSVQQRLENMGKDEKSEAKVLKISELVNTATAKLEDDLLEIKETLSEKTPQNVPAEPKAEAIDPVLEGDVAAAEGEGKEGEGVAVMSSDSGSVASSTPQEGSATTTVEAVPQKSAETSAKEGSSKNLLQALETALDAVDRTNIKSLEVYVEKAQTSKSEVVQQEAVDKIQKKIDKIEKKVDADILEKAQSAASSQATSSASSSVPILDKAPNTAPSQIKEAISQAKKILDGKNIQELNQVMEKVKEVKAIVKDAAQASADSAARKAAEESAASTNQNTNQSNPSTSASTTTDALLPNPAVRGESVTASSVKEVIQVQNE